MSNLDDDRYAREVIRAVGDLTKRLEEHTSTRDAAFKQLQESVEGVVVSMRQDFWKTTIAIQRDATQHRDEHIVDRGERTHRQTTVDVWMGALTLLGLINLALILYLAFALR
jgi:hypothetical protein